jgi:hypothetical protein
LALAESAKRLREGGTIAQERAVVEMDGKLFLRVAGSSTRSHCGSCS